MKYDCKPVLIPDLSYQAVKLYAECHNLKIYEVMHKLLFQWTLNFWSDPENYGCSTSSDPGEKDSTSGSPQ